MISGIRQFLIRKGWYYALRYSRLFDLYAWIFKPEVLKQYHKELQFYQSFLSSCDLIFDIGAFDGHKTKVFQRLSTKVVACEPDPFNYNILIHRFHRGKNVFPEQLVITDFSGKTTLHVHHPGSAFNTINPDWIRILEADQEERWNEKILFSANDLEVSCTTLDNLIARYGLPDFIKIDAEGSEWQIIRGLNQKVVCLSFEVLLPEYKSDALSCISHLVSLNDRMKFNYAVDEKLQLPEFLDQPSFVRVLEQLNIPHLEIIAKSGAG